MVLRRYLANNINEWNSFNESCKNSLFMFNRYYMDYHNDRFFDHSLLFYQDDMLIALFPACEKDGMLLSHAGLTYGGFLVGEAMKQHIMNECFHELVEYCKNKGIHTIRYKCIPSIYHKQAAEEDRYALFSSGFKLISVDVSTYLKLNDPLKASKGRRAQISRAKREGVVIKRYLDRDSYRAFISLENRVLIERHGVQAVHTADELFMLHERFLDNIHLFGAEYKGKMIAGTIIYEYENVIHTQYMAADETARRIGALDLTVQFVKDYYGKKKKWLDFGISTEHDNGKLNEGLAFQKESFGGRTGVYEVWEMKLGQDD